MDIPVLDINGGPQSPGIPCNVVGKDYGSHAGLARPTFTHKKYLFLHD